MAMLALTPHDMLVWAMCILCIVAAFFIALLGEDIGEPWATLILWALVIACAVLAGWR